MAKIVTLCYTDAPGMRRWFWADEAGESVEIAGQEFFNSQADAINRLEWEYCGGDQWKP